MAIEGKIVILGGTSRLGARILETLKSLGATPSKVVAGGRNPEKLEAIKAQGFSTVVADYTMKPSLEGAMKGAETVILIPSLSPPGPRCVEYANAVEAAQAAGVKHIVTSSLMTTKDVKSNFPINAFELFNEACVASSGIPYSILRSSLYMDEVVDWCVSDDASAPLALKNIPYPTGNGKASYAHRDDIGAALANAAWKPEISKNRIFDLTGPDALSTKDLCDILAKTSGKKMEYKKATDADYAAVCVGIPEFFVKWLTCLYHDVDDGYFTTVSGHIKELTGNDPISFESALKDAFAKKK